MILNIIQISLRLIKDINFRSVSDVRNFESLISGFLSQDQKMQNLILEGVIKGFSRSKDILRLQNRFQSILAKNDRLEP